MASLQSPVHAADAQALQDLHQGIVVELGRWNDMDPQRTTSREAALQGDIDRSISAIEVAGTAIELLANKCSVYEEELDTFKKIVSELNFRLESAHEKLARAERDAQSANNRAARSETQANELGDRIKKKAALEAELTGNLDRMIKAVKQNFASSVSFKDHGFRKALRE